LALLAAAALVAFTLPTALSGYGTSGLQIRENGKDTCSGSGRMEGVRVSIKNRGRRSVGTNVVCR